MELRELIDRAAARREHDTFRPVLLDASSPDGARELASLLARPEVVVVDTLGDQLEELVRARAPRDELTPAETAARVRSLLSDTPLERFGTWAFYPWSSVLVHVLPRAMHRELRSDRNRYKVTTEEQESLRKLTIGVVGLSVGSSVVATLVREGIGGSLRLADFDTLSLSNLNRLEGGLPDVGLNKAVLSARRVAELDPYIDVQIHREGVQTETLGTFLQGLDVLIDECDDLAVKVALREAAQRARLPVVMATSDRGMLDIERFDREPDRALFHGLLEGVSAASLRGLSTKQKVPYVLRLLDGASLEPRMLASLVEVKETLSTWPQLASTVVLGGAMVTNAVRRIALGELTTSGRFYADLDALVRDGSAHVFPPLRAFHPEAARRGDDPAALARPAAGEGPRPSHDEMRFLVDCATRAPSGGNAQPWTFVASGDRLTCRCDPRGGALLDFERRASALALGAALENAVLAAGAIGFDADVAVDGAGPAWSLRLARSSSPRGDGAAVLELLRVRCSNRRTERSEPIPAEALAALAAAASPSVVTAVTGDALARLADTLGEADRLQFLSEKFHKEIFSEIRWTKAEALARRDGLDVASLEMDASDLAVLEVLRSHEAMAFLARHGLGRALGKPARDSFRASGAAVVISTREADRAAIVEAGRHLQRLWLTATEHQLALHPWGSPFLFQRVLEEPAGLLPWEREILARTSSAFRELLAIEPGVTPLLVLRVSKGASPTARSLRRSVDDVLRFEGA